MSAHLILTVEIPNWEKFNPRSDRANYSWFRLQNDFFHDQRVFMLTAQQQIIYLFLLCEASKKNKGQIQLSPEYVSALLKRAVSDILNDIIAITKAGLVESDACGVLPAERRHDDGNEPTKLPATYVRTNETNETVAGGVEPPPALPIQIKPTKKVSEPKSKLTWEAYSKAYNQRYGADPVRNQTVNTQLARLVDRLGAEEAPLVAEFYLRHNSSYYVSRMHAVGCLLSDAEKLRTEWATGRKMLSTQAREIERIQNNTDVFADAARILKQRESTNG